MGREDKWMLEELGFDDWRRHKTKSRTKLYRINDDSLNVCVRREWTIDHVVFINKAVSFVAFHENRGKSSTYSAVRY